MTYETFLRMDISVPMEIEPYGLIVPWPKEESRLLAPIRPFQPMVIYKWLPIIKLTMYISDGFRFGCILELAFAPIISWIASFYRKFIQKKAPNEPIADFNSIGRSIFFLFSHVSNHGLNNQNLIL